MPPSFQLSNSADFPRRIVCLTDETTETLYLLGEQDRIVGVSGFTTRPPAAGDKPRVSAFRDANLEAILDLKPDLIFTFSDVQAEITRNLVLRGATVFNFNTRSISEIFDMISLLARLVGKPDEGRASLKLCKMASTRSKVQPGNFRAARVFTLRSGTTR